MFFHYTIEERFEINHEISIMRKGERCMFGNSGEAHCVFIKLLADVISKGFFRT